VPSTVPIDINPSTERAERQGFLESRRTEGGGPSGPADANAPCPPEVKSARGCRDGTRHGAIGIRGAVRSSKMQSSSGRREAAGRKEEAAWRRKNAEIHHMGVRLTASVEDANSPGMQRNLKELK